jgi:hypothetical protein
MTSSGLQLPVAAPWTASLPAAEPADPGGTTATDGMATAATREEELPTAIPSRRPPWFAIALLTFVALVVIGVISRRYDDTGSPRLNDTDVDVPRGDTPAGTR